MKKILNLLIFLSLSGTMVLIIYYLADISLFLAGCISSMLGLILFSYVLIARLARIVLPRTSAFSRIRFTVEEADAILFEVDDLSVEDVSNVNLAAKGDMNAVIAFLHSRAVDKTIDFRLVPASVVENLTIKAFEAAKKPEKMNVDLESEFSNLDLGDYQN